MVLDSKSLRENKCVTVFAFLVFLALATFSDVNKIFPSSWLILYLKTVSVFWKPSSKWLNICSPFLFIPLKWSSFTEQAVKLSGRASDCSFIYFYWAWGISYMEAACIWTVWLTMLRWGRRKGRREKGNQGTIWSRFKYSSRGNYRVQHKQHQSLKSRNKKALWYYFCLTLKYF